jgi:N-acyl-D-amino-acid deacylase
MLEFSIIIRNGRVIDGSGNPWYKADIGIEDEKIRKIGNLSKESANIEIDASEYVVCPGFIDVHSHSDTSFFSNPKADSKITQGITTEIVGNCGNSAAPITDLGKEFIIEKYADKNVECTWNSVSEYLDQLDKIGMPLNVGTLIGHGTIRSSIMGFEARDPSLQELEAMKAMVEEGMKEGAFGLSTGLKYAPGCYANTNEVVELCKVVNKYDGLYATHIRNQGDYLIDSIDETIEIGKKAKVPIIISHLKAKTRKNWGKSSNVLRIIDESRDSGIDITFDQYPYIAGSSNLFARLPAWSREGGPSNALERLKDPEQRKKIEEDIPKGEDWYGPNTSIIAGFSPNPEYEGKSLEEIGEIRNKTPESIVCDLLLEANGIVPIVGFYGWEEDVLKIMKHHTMMVGSDGSSLAAYGVLGRGKPHPRSYGAFTRYLGQYVLRDKVTSIQDGIRRMTSLPAIRYNLFNRSILQPHNYADIVIFDQKKLIDKATFNNPHQYSQGIQYVIVNGKISVENEKYTGELSGKSLRYNSIP